jgi:hypothetical protein
MPTIANYNTYYLNNQLWLNGNIWHDPVNNQNQPLYAMPFALTQSAPPNTISHFNDFQDSYDIIAHKSPGFTPDYVMGPVFWNNQIKETYTTQELRALNTMGYNYTTAFLTSNTINPPNTNATVVNNRHPFTNKNIIDLSWSLGGAYTLNEIDDPAFTAADFNITNCQSINISLASDNSIIDANSTNPKRIFPGSLYNIRGCGINGNNHNALTVTSTPTGDIITYNPRPDFIGRAQFGFHLYDGIEKGAFMIYTVDVSACNPCPTNIVVNGSFEEGAEIKTQANPTPDNSSMLFYRDMKYQGFYASILPDGITHTTTATSVVRNSNLCTANEGYFGWPFHSFGGFGSAPNANFAAHGDRYYRVSQENTLFNLCSSPQQCNQYIIEFDINTNQNFNLIAGFTNTPSNGTGFIPVVNPVTIPITATGGIWQHISIPFNYCSTQQAPFLVLQVPLPIANNTFYIDNLDLHLNPVQPVFSVQVNPLSSTICAGDNIQLNTQIFNPYCNLTYNWSPATGLSCTNCPNPLASPTNTTTYTLTVNDGCSTITEQITINVINNSPLCCAASTHTIPNGTTSSSLGAIPNGSVIDVLGLFTINSNLTLTSCTLRMAPNAKIDVLTGNTFALTGCTVFSCTDMWDGIYSNPGANVNITLSRIEDATYAVYSVNGGNYNLFFSTFNKNNISLYVDNFNATHPGIVRRCIFECVATSSPTPGATLKAPMAGQISHFGIYCRNNVDITFGQVSAQPNIFRFIEIGIYALNTQLKVYRNNFTNITEPYCLTTFPPTTPCPTIGWPIWVQSCRLTVGDPAGTSHQNNFTNCSNGIFIDGKSSFDIQKNNFTNIVTTGFLGSLIYSKCIYSRFNAGDFPGIIHDNVFTNFEAGIYYQANKLSSFTVLRNKMSNFNTSNGTAIYLLQNQAHPIQIKNNLINDLPNQSGWYAIRVQNAVQPSNNVLIAENTIKNVRHGVWTTNYDNIIIKDQTTAFTSIGTNQAGIYYPNTVPSILSVGIKVENCPKTNVYNNLIQKAMPNPTTSFTNMLYGISVETNSVGTNVQENEVRRLGKGLNFYGTPNGPLTVSCNKIYQNRTGVSLNNTFIGDQGMPNPSGVAQDNQWSIPGNISTNWLGAERIGTPISPPTTWYSRSTALPFFPNQINQMNPASPTPALTFGNASGAPYNCSFGCANPPCFHLIVKKMIIKDVPFNGLDSDIEQIIDMKAYQLIKQDSAYTNTGTSDDALFIAYRDSLATTNIGKLYEFTEKLEAGDTLGAYSSLMAVNPTRCPEVSQKVVYEIYWKTWARNIFEFTPADSLLLYQIADQRPHICGTAVYDARVMLGLDFNDFEDAQPRMASNETNEEINVWNEEGELKIVLYPNPAGDFIMYRTNISDNENAVLIIYNMLGEAMHTEKINVQQREGRIDLSAFISGMYLYKVYINNTPVRAGPFVISK